MVLKSFKEILEELENEPLCSFCRIQFSCPHQKNPKPKNYDDCKHYEKLPDYHSEWEDWLHSRKALLARYAKHKRYRRK